MFLLSLVGVIGCVLVFRWEPPPRTPIDPAARAMAAAGALISALTGLLAARRLFDPSPGLVLDAEGIVDRTSPFAGGRVRWDEITELRLVQSMRRKFLLVMVADPRRYIDRGSPLRRKLTEANYRKTGSPIHIPLRALGMGPDQLMAHVGEYYRRYGTPR